MTSQLNGTPRAVRPAAPGPTRDPDPAGPASPSRPVRSRAGRHAGRRTTPRERLVGLGAALATVLLLTGPPTLLSLSVGWPLPHHLPTMGELHTFLLTPLTDQAVLDVLATVGWLLWANLAFAVLLELTAHVRGLTPPQLPLMTVNQHLAHQLISATLLLLPTGQSLLTGASLPGYTRAVAVSPYPTDHPTRTTPELHSVELGQQPTHSAATDPTRAIEASDPAPAPGASAVRSGPVTPATTYPVQARPAALKQYTVDPPAGRHHDSLWDIAARHLGDGRRYPEIFALNHGRPQPDGDTLSKASLIRPGWVLLLPPDATGPDLQLATATPKTDREPLAEPQPIAPTGHRPGTPTTVQPAAGQPPVPHESDAPPRSASDTPPVVSGPLLGPSPVPLPASSAAAGSGPAQQAAGIPASSVIEAHQPTPHGPVAKPAEHWDAVVELLGLGLGAVAALAALTRARKAAQRRRRPGRRLPPTPLPLRPVETALRREAQQQTVIAAEVRAACALAAATTPQAVGGMIVAVLRHDDHSLELLTDHAPSTTGPAPVPFTTTTRGWQLAAADRGFLKAADCQPDPLPVLLPVGRIDPTRHHDPEDPHDQGQLYVDLTRPGLISLTGSLTDCDDYCLTAAGQLVGAPWAGLARALMPTALAERLGPLERLEPVTDLTARTPDLLTYARSAVSSDGTADGELADAERAELATPTADTAAEVVAATTLPDHNDHDDDAQGDADEASSMMWMVLIGWPAEQLPAELIDAALDPDQPLVIVTSTRHPRARQTWQLQDGRLGGVLGQWQLEFANRNPQAAYVPALLQHAAAPDVAPDDPTLQALREDSPPQPPPALPTAPDQVLAGVEAPAARSGLQGGSETGDPLPPEQMQPRSAGAEPAADTPDDTEVLVQIDVLGPVQLRRAELPRRLPVLQVLVYLAVHRRVVSAEQLGTALWPDKRVANQTLRNRVGEARDVMKGNISKGPGWRLDPRVSTDWQQFQHLAAGDTDSQRRALALVRGLPFEDLPDAEWIDTEGLRSQIEAAIVDVALNVGEHALGEGEPAQAFWAARTGLRASPYEERLFRLAMRAADAEGATGKIRALMRELRTVLDLELEPDDTIQPETLSLYRELLNQPRPGID